jgi:hypothetical protein
MSKGRLSGPIVSIEAVFAQVAEPHNKAEIAESVESVVSIGNSDVSEFETAVEANDDIEMGVAHVHLTGQPCMVLSEPNGFGPNQPLP